MVLLVKGLPLTEMTPESKLIRPLKAFNREVLPLPEGPIIAKTWPGAAHPETWARIVFWMGPDFAVSISFALIEPRKSPEFDSLTWTDFSTRLHRRNKPSCESSDMDALGVELLGVFCCSSSIVDVKFLGSIQWNELLLIHFLTPIIYVRIGMMWSMNEEDVRFNN
jgi:hypothetical protein